MTLLGPTRVRVLAGLAGLAAGWWAGGPPVRPPVRPPVHAGPAAPAPAPPPSPEPEAPRWSRTRAALADLLPSGAPVPAPDFHPDLATLEAAHRIWTDFLPRLPDTLRDDPLPEAAECLRAFDLWAMRERYVDPFRDSTWWPAVPEDLHGARPVISRAEPMPPGAGVLALELVPRPGPPRDLPCRYQPAPGAPQVQVLPGQDIVARVPGGPPGDLTLWVDVVLPEIHLVRVAYATADGVPVVLHGWHPVRSLPEPSRHFRGRIGWTLPARLGPPANATLAIDAVPVPGYEAVAALNTSRIRGVRITP